MVWKCYLGLHNKAAGFSWSLSPCLNASAWFYCVQVLGPWAPHLGGLQAEEKRPSLWHWHVFLHSGPQVLPPRKIWSSSPDSQGQEDTPATPQLLGAPCRPPSHPSDDPSANPRSSYPSPVRKNNISGQGWRKEEVSSWCH